MKGVTIAGQLRYVRARAYESLADEGTPYKPGNNRIETTVSKRSSPQDDNNNNAVIIVGARGGRLKMNDSRAVFCQRRTFYATSFMKTRRTEKNRATTRVI